MKEIMKQHYNLSYVLTKLSILTNNKKAYTEEEAIQIQKALTQYKDITTKIDGLFTEFNQSLIDTINKQPQQDITTPFADLSKEQIDSIVQPKSKLFVVSLSETTQLHVQSLKKNEQPIPKEFDFFVRYALVQATSLNHAMAIARNHIDTSISTNDYEAKEVTLPAFFDEHEIEEGDKALIINKIKTNVASLYTKALA